MNEPAAQPAQGRWFVDEGIICDEYGEYDGDHPWEVCNRLNALEAEVAKLKALIADEITVHDREEAALRAEITVLKARIDEDDALFAAAQKEPS